MWPKYRLLSSEIVLKGEIAGFSPWRKHWLPAFSLFPQTFSKGYIIGSLNSELCSKR